MMSPGPTLSRAATELCSRQRASLLNAEVQPSLDGLKRDGLASAKGASGRTVLRLPVGRVALEPRHRAFRGVVRVRKGTLTSSFKPDLQQDSLSRVILQDGHAGDARQLQVNEAVAQHRGRPLGP